MTPEEEALFDKDITEVTPADVERMMHILEEEGEKDMQQALKDLNAAAAEVAKSAINSAAAEVMETLATDGAKDGANAAILALNEYSKTYKGSVHDFFTDPNLPEVLALIRDRANEILLELAGNDGKNIFIENKLSQPRPSKPTGIEFPLDKINSRIWNLLETETTTKNGMPGQLFFDLAGKAKAGTPAKAPALYSINFEELDKVPELQTIIRRLTPYDKRVYVAISALYNTGNKAMSLLQIHYAMGNTTRASAAQLAKIEESIKKMMAVIITLAHSEAAEKLGYEKYTHTSHLLPAVIDTGYKYGKIVQSKVQIRPLTEPPLMTYAKMRHQVTTINERLLQSPINKTEANIAIDDYLIDTIAHAKRSHERTVKRLYSTLCKETKQTTAKQQQRIPEKVKTLLDHYASCNYIKGYKTTADAVVIEL